MLWSSGSRNVIPSQSTCAMEASEDSLGIGIIGDRPRLFRKKSQGVRSSFVAFHMHTPLHHVPPSPRRIGDRPRLILVIRSALCLDFTYNLNDIVFQRGPRNRAGIWVKKDNGIRSRKHYSSGSN